MKNSQTFHDVRAVLSRLFMGRISVRGGNFQELRQAGVRRNARNPRVYSLPSRKEEKFVYTSISPSSVECRSSSVLLLYREGCPVHVGLQAMERPQVTYVPCGFSPTLRGNLLQRKKMKVLAALDRMYALPQKRNNLVGYLKNRFPGTPKAGIFAFFSPLIRSCVRKTALDKNAGTLDVWMEPRKAGMRSYHLLLMKTPGETKLRWVWIEAGKNDNIFGGGVG